MSMPKRDYKTRFVVIEFDNEVTKEDLEYISNTINKPAHVGDIVKIYAALEDHAGRLIEGRARQSRD